MMLNLILPFLTGIIPDVIKRVLPAEKMSEGDRASLERELTLAVMAADWKSVEAEYADRNSARDLAKADIASGNALTGALAAGVRPLWGIGAFVLVAYYVVTGAEIKPAIQSIVETVIVFYFGGRVVEKVTPTISGALKK